VKENKGEWMSLREMFKRGHTHKTGFKFRTSNEVLKKRGGTKEISTKRICNNCKDRIVGDRFEVHFLNNPVSKMIVDEGCLFLLKDRGIVSYYQTLTEKKQIKKGQRERLEYLTEESLKIHMEKIRESIKTKK